MLRAHPEDPAASQGKLAQFLILFPNFPPRNPSGKAGIASLAAFNGKNSSPAEDFLIPNTLEGLEFPSSTFGNFFFQAEKGKIPFSQEKSHFPALLCFSFFFLHWRIPRFYLGKNDQRDFYGISQRAHPKFQVFPFSCFSQLRTFSIAFGSCYSQNSQFSDAPIFIFIPGMIPHLGIPGGLEKAQISPGFGGNSRKKIREIMEF